MGPRFLAVDWGTTNRRVFVIDQGRVMSTERDDRGAHHVEKDAYPQEVANIRERFGDLPMLLAGMVGSNIGWRLAPYVPAPAGLPELVSNLLWIDGRTAIVPGVSNADPPDVMRGEEVQLLGAIAAGFAPADSLLVQPGTHCKWARMTCGRITGFTTAMTGELFAMLRAHSLLAPQLAQQARPGAAFEAGLQEGRARDLSASLFRIRAAGLLGSLADNDAASFASGLLIGADVAARLEHYTHHSLYILADPVLGALYATAVKAHGRLAHLVDSPTAFAAGAAALGALVL